MAQEELLPPFIIGHRKWDIVAESNLYMSLLKQNFVVFGLFEIPSLGTRIWNNLRLDVLSYRANNKRKVLSFGR
ncbi:hypothetical protein NHJ13051_007067 [Beauveria bassiana]